MFTFRYISWVSFFVAAETVLQSKVHDISGHQLRVSRVSFQANEPTKKAMASQDQNPGCAVLVTGLKPSTEKDMLELFFENTKRSGGGEIKHIEMNEKSGRAIIHFADKAGKRKN